MLEQDVRAELLDLKVLLLLFKKTRQLIAILAEDIRKRSHKAEQQMLYEMKGLRRETEALISSDM
jgi:hypothetical protein